MRAFLYLLLATLCLSTIGLFVKLIGDAIPVMSIAFLRVLVAFVFLALFALFFHRQTFRTKKKTLLEYFWIGMLMAAAFSLYTAANLFAPIQNAVLLSYTSPFFVLIAARFILKEKITKAKLVAVIIAFVGLTIINPFSEGAYALGNSFALMNAVFFALFLTLIRKERVQHDIGNVMWYMLFATIVLLPFAMYHGFGNILLVWKELLLLGILSTALAYLFMNLAMKDIEAEITSISSMILVPLFAILLAAIFLSEQLENHVIIGGLVLIVAGVFLELAHSSKARKFFHLH